MAKLNNPIASQLQSKTFAEVVKSTIRSKDLNYKGFDSSSVLEVNEVDFEADDQDANINRVLFWLQMKADDSPRDTRPCGIMYEMLGKIGSDGNISQWENRIKASFDEYFSDLSLPYLKIHMNKMTKTIVMDMIVFDINGKTSQNMEVEGKYD